MSNIIRHRLIVATHALTTPKKEHGATHVLYLPADEIHELGLLYLNYLLRAKGERTIYLGQSVPAEDLRQVVALHQGRIVFVTVLMANPPASEVPQYLLQLRAMVPDDRVEFWLTGSQLARTEAFEVPQGMHLHPSMGAVISALDAREAD